LGLEPITLPETAPFWEGADANRLMIQRCRSCANFYFPPAPICPSCTSRDIEWTQASGRATLYSFAIAQSPWPQWSVSGPMSVAMIQLEEGPRLLSTIVDCGQTVDALELDMPLTATWRPFGERPNLLCFKPSAETQA
jgi:uncharacterized OB-fold protein